MAHRSAPAATETVAVELGAEHDERHGHSVAGPDNDVVGFVNILVLVELNRQRALVLKIWLFISFSKNILHLMRDIGSMPIQLDLLEILSMYFYQMHTRHNADVLFDELGGEFDWLHRRLKALCQNVDMVSLRGSFYFNEYV